MHRNKYQLCWISWSMLVMMVKGVRGDEGGCPHPPVPASATYVNVTGGLGQKDWVVRYICDNGKQDNFYNKTRAKLCCQLHFLSNLLVLQCKDCNAVLQLQVS